MKISTLALVLGSALTVSGSAATLSACSSSSTPLPTASHDAGTLDASGSSSGSGSGGGSGSGSGGAVEAGPDCGSIPELRPDDAGTIFCGFGADGGDLDCPTSMECCLGGGIGGDMFAPQECATFGETCTNGGGAEAGTNLQPIGIECAQIADCTSNGKMATACCLQGAKSSTVAGCGYPKYSDGTGIICEGTGGGAVTACAAGEVQVCSSQADCPNGTTCTAGKWKILQLGFCM